MMQLLASLDGFEDRGNIRIIAATNRFDMLDEAILRPGRFDRLIKISAPNQEGRLKIFGIHSKKINMDSDTDFEILAEKTDNFSGADIKSVCTEAGMIAIREKRTIVTQKDFISAIDSLTVDASENEDVSMAFA
jgi:proteasome regulatory subunit